VTVTARRHQMFEPDTRVLVAVSGGADSLCLLHSLVRLERLLRIEVTCFHFDHGLRPDSTADAAYVRRQARRLGVPFVLRKAHAGLPPGASPEAWARTVRYEALTSALEELGGGIGAVGHTADDRAETVLLALLRGGGLEAFTGMRAVSRPVVRPLLDTTRQETAAFCGSLSLRPRTDPMNEDPAYMRAAVRSAIPKLERVVGRGIRTTLARTAQLLEQDADLLDRLSVEAERSVISRMGDELRLHAGALCAVPRPLGSRVVRRVLLDLGVAPEAAHVDAVLDLARGRPGRATSLPGRLKARREREYVRLSRPSPTGRGVRLGGREKTARSEEG
jgi:tRNA(Ile)-lysidine synthase